MIITSFQISFSLYLLYLSLLIQKLFNKFDFIPKYYYYFKLYFNTESIKIDKFSEHADQV